MSAMPETSRLESMKARWEELQKQLPEPIQVPNAGAALPKSSYSDWFDYAIHDLRILESESLDPAVRVVVWPEITGQINAINDRLNEFNNGAKWWIGQGRPVMLITALLELRKRLAWVLPNPPLSDGRLALSLNEVVVSANKAASAARAAREAETSADESKKGIDAAVKEVQGTIAAAHASQRDASAAETTAKASALAAEQAKASVVDLTNQLNDDVEKQKKLISFFEDRQAQVESVLEGASKIALAHSFRTRREALEKERKSWTQAFVVGLLLLFLSATLAVGGFDWIAAVLKLPAPTAQAAQSATDQSRVFSYLTHVLVLGPLIWWSWFSARKLGQLSRFAEDYAFKEATALSFVGYRNEMGDDSAMLEQLRKSAIENFGANPLRVVTKDEPASPLHDLLEQILSKVSPDKLLEVLAAVLKKT